MTPDPGSPGRRARVAVVTLIAAFAVWFAAVTGVGWWGSDPDPVLDAVFVFGVSAPVVLVGAAAAGRLRRRNRWVVLRWVLFTGQVTWVGCVALVGAFSYEGRTSYSTPKASWLLNATWAVVVLLLGWWLEDAIARRRP